MRLAARAWISPAALLTRRSAVPRSVIRTFTNPLERAADRDGLAASAGDADDPLCVSELIEIDADDTLIQRRGDRLAGRRQRTAGRCPHSAPCAQVFSSCGEKTLPLEASSFEGSVAPMPTSATVSDLNNAVAC